MTGRKNALRLLVALLLVASTIPAPALAQSDNEYSHQFTTGPQEVVVDQSNISGDFTVTVSSTEVTGRSGEKTLLAQKRLGPGTEEKIVFMNEGAYDNITLEVTIHDSGEPEFMKGSDVGIDVPYIIGHTGGDADLQCNEDEKLFSMTNPMVEVVDCTPPVDNSVNTTDIDAEQAKIDMYQSAQNHNASSEVYMTTLDNYLEDTKTQARIIGKNAYIRSLNNGSSEAAAKTAAKGAVADYYATKQANLAKKWGAQAAHYEYLNSVTANESGITGTSLVSNRDGNSKVKNDGYLTVEIASSDSYSSDADPQYLGTSQESMTLANGSSTDVAAFGFEITYTYSGSTATDTSWVTLTTGDHQLSAEPDGSSAVKFTPSGLGVKAPNTNYDRQTYLDFTAFKTRWSEIESQNTQVQNDMDTLATNTYDEYQSGEINNSDLVDPYVLSNDFSAGEEHQSWAAAQLTLLGTNSPEAMSNMGEFNVTTADGTTHTGILMSQSNPSTGQFEVNTTYDTANITGPQFVVTPDRLVELDGEFTVDSIETTDGESRENVTIEKTTYETADINVTQLIEEYEQLQKERAEWEAREQNMQSGAGGFALGNSTSLGILAALAGGMLLLNGRRDDGGRY